MIHHTLITVCCCLLLSATVHSAHAQNNRTAMPHDIFRIKGLKIGQAQDTVGKTGVTVLLFEDGAVVGAVVRGSAPGTRETDLLRPGNLVEKVHAVVLSGGSAFGLASMDGVAAYLEEQGVGYETGVAKVPIVTGAVLFDLAVGDARARPDADMGYAAAQSAGRTTFAEGGHGAGTGASVGKLRGQEYASPGGIGCTVLTFPDGLVVAAVVAVNALGDIYEGEEIVAGMLNEEKNAWLNSEDYVLQGYQTRPFGGNTTLGVIITNAKLTKAQAQKLASVAHDGFARSIRPAHTLYDGDIIFAAATGEVEFSDMLFLSTAAQRAAEQAVLRAVKR